MNNEKAIENEILNFLLSKNIFAWKNQSIGVFDPTKGSFRKRSKFQINGVSDILGFFNDKFIAIEVKSEKGRLSDYQKHFLKVVNDHGHIGIVARNLEQVKDALKIK